jgi:alginate O-acetyltransferase complex protein AlgI
MIFNSLQFLVFFMVVTLLYYQIKNQRGRVWLLLLSSCYFYMSFVPVYILILGATIVIDYIAGILISGSQGKQRKLWLIMSILANVGILVFYKYFNFLLDNIAPVLKYLAPHYELPYLNIILPIGLSFHTFQAMSYTIEVYRGNQKPEKDFIVYALYVMFYPQLVAGPIERPQNMIYQFHEYKEYDWNNVKEGLARMLWGFFKKVVIADRVAMAVDYAFENQNSLNSWSLMVAAMLYSFQIYCDFSGYSDIALGSSKVMGIKLMENFNQPYISKSISEFWTRWHISLSTWFRDYVYIPLGGNKKGEARRRLNSFIIFLLSGLWHGANWTFVVWGTLHGALVNLSRGRKSDREAGAFRTVVFVIVNFLLVTICWVFFRASNLHEAANFLGRIFSLKGGATKFGLSATELLVSAVFIGIMMLREYKWNSHYIRSDKSFALYTTLMVVVCYLFGVFGESQFIYFQF